MAKQTSTPRLMIVSDLDHTMVDHHDEDDTSLLRFNALWQAEYNFDSTLVFSTGRSPTLYKELRSAKPLATPHIAIMSVGTEIMYGDTMTPDSAWETVLNEGWDRSVVVEEAKKYSQLSFQADTEQRPHKVSFSCRKADAEEVVASLSERLRKRGLEAKIIYSGGTDLDVLPQGAGKGEALAYLLRRYEAEGTSPRTTLVCGDSGNDAELFSVPGVHGVIVGNAQEELLHWHDLNAKNNPKIFLATERCAAAILQALQHFKIEPNVSPRDVDPIHGLPAIEAGSLAAPAHLIVQQLLVYERYIRGEVDDSGAVFDFFNSLLAENAEGVSHTGLRYRMRDVIQELRSKYGFLKGSNFRVWADRVRPTRLGENGWLVTFDRQQRSGANVSCRVATAVLLPKDGARYGLQVIRVHETLLSDSTKHA